MKKKLSSLYCAFVPCKSFVSDFFIVEKTFAFYEKFLFSEEQTLLFSKAETFAKMGKNRENRESFCPRKFLVKSIFSPIHNKVSLFKYCFFILVNILTEWNCDPVPLLLDLEDLLLTIL